MVDQFRNDDKVVFIGDSITRGTYPVFIRVFYATRYPARNIQMDECAIGGDTVPGTLRRLDASVNQKFFKDYKEKNKKEHRQIGVYQDIHDKAIEYSDNKEKYNEQLKKLDSVIREKSQPKIHHFKIEKI